MEERFDARRLLGHWTHVSALIGAIGIMILATAVVLDVFMRVMFNAPILGVDDLSKIILAVIVSSFFPVCLVGGHFVTIRFMGKALGQRGACWLEVLGGTGTFFIFVLLAWQFFRFTLFDVTITGLETDVLEFPLAPWWWVVTAIIFACVPIQLAVLIEDFIRAIGGGQPAYEARKESGAETGG